MFMFTRLLIQLDKNISSLSIHYKIKCNQKISGENRRDSSDLITQRHPRVHPLNTIYVNSRVMYNTIYVKNAELIFVAKFLAQNKACSVNLYIKKQLFIINQNMLLLLCHDNIGRKPAYLNVDICYA